MKQILLCAFSLSILTLVGCKKNVTPAAPDGGNASSESMIFLGVSGPVTRAANAGVRDTIFEKGDQIGVIAAYSTTIDPDDPQNLADWTKAVYFDNAPACFVKNAKVETDLPSGNGKYDDNRSYFGWGPAAEGAMAWNKYYPAQDKPIMIYGYYPYTNVNTIYVAPDGKATLPMLNVKLNIDTVRLGVGNKGANVKQSDILSYVSMKEVKRTDTLKIMTFKHALSQLNFRFKRYKGSAIAFVDTIVFSTVREATMDITTSLFSYKLDANGSQDTLAKYVIIPEANKREVPVVTELVDKRKETGLLNIFDGAVTGTGSAAIVASPLMVLPLDNALLKKSTLRVVINISPDGTGDDKERKSMTIALDKLTTKFEAGKKSTFDILVTQSGIALEAKIEPWDNEGSVSDLETAD